MSSLAFKNSAVIIASRTLTRTFFHISLPCQPWVRQFLEPAVKLERLKIPSLGIAIKYTDI